MQKVKKNKKGLIATLCAGLLACLFAFITPLTAYAWDFYGLDMADAESIDLYYMDISVGELWSHMGDGGGMPLGDNVSKRGNRALMMRFQFPQFLDTTGTTKEGDVFFIQKQVTLNCPGKGQIHMIFAPHAGYHFVNEDGSVADKVTISLSNNYYKYLIRSPGVTQQEDGSFIGSDYLKNFYIKVENGNITYQFGGDTKGKRDGIFNNEIRLYSVSSDPDKVNPDSENVDLNAGNTGDQHAPPDISGNKLEGNENKPPVNFWQWLANLFGQPVSAIITVVIIIAVIIGGIFLIKFLKWAFK